MMRSSSSGGAWAAVGGLVVAALSSGCYGYVPASASAVSPGEEVRVRVSESAVRDFGSALTRAGPVLEGRVLESDSESLLLHVLVGDRRRGFYREGLRQRILVEGDQLQAVERRELHRAKTWSLVGVGALAAGSVVAGILTGDSGGPTSELPEGPSTAVLSLFRLMELP